MRKGGTDKADNRGMALVLVIVAIALASILVAVLFSISLLNYRMKVTERHSKDNFYSAEIVLDQIHAGLQQEVSQAVGLAYSRAMQTYKTTTEEARVAVFRSDYMNTICNSLKNPVSGDISAYYVGGPQDSQLPVSGIYQHGIVSYLDTALVRELENGSLRVSSADPKMLSTTEGLRLKDLLVEYTDSDGYYSRIQTDILIGFPDISLKESTILPNVFEYTFLADTGIVVSQVSAAVFEESVYAGAEGIVVSGHSDLAFDSANYLVTPGNVKVDNTSEFRLSGGSLWANGIDVQGGTLELNGSTYIADDLTLSKTSSLVHIGGSYIGYGSGNGPGQQSAIIINGNKSTIDLSGLDELLLYGNSYINAQNITYEAGTDFTGQDHNTQNNILLGNSLSLKSDQIVYLAPAECLGTMNDTVLVGKNPMSAQEYTKWVQSLPEAEGAAYKKLDVNKETKILGKPLAMYGLTEESFKTVFRTINGESICYVYLDMSADQAAVYYRDYAEAADETLKKYADRYQNNILLRPEYTRIFTRGNLVSYNTMGGGLSIVPNTIYSGMDGATETALRVRQLELEKTYQALCSKLSANYEALTQEELGKSVYENVIRTDVLNSLTSPQIYESGGYKAIITKEDVSVTQGDKVKLVISTGDVEVSGSFSGLIIAGGRIIVRPGTGAVFSADKENVTRLLNYKTGDANKSIIATYFVDGSRYALEGSGADWTEEHVNLEKIVAFDNWKKE